MHLAATLLLAAVLCCWQELAAAAAVLPSIGRRLHRGAAALVISAALSYAPFAIAAGVDGDSIDRYTKVLYELKALDSTWSDTIKGGDDVRRVLGTVYSNTKGCTSSLCGFTQFQNKFVGRYGSELDDFGSFEQSSSELLEALNQADFLSYSSNFADYGNGGGGADYIKDSRKQIRRAVTSLEEILPQIRKQL